MSLDTKVFINRMRNVVYGDTTWWSNINRLLIENNALIAGGSVLSPYIDIDGRINDLDIYIHRSNAIAFVEGLTTSTNYSFTKRGNYIQPAYDQSFFRKNNIIARFRLYFRNYPPMDIMIIPDEIPILNVVTNFDLTFCEIWYDGKTVTAVDPQGITNRTGKLKKDYVNSFLLHLNQFTIKRVLKYVKKGLTITYDSEKIRNTFLRQSKKVTSPEEWVVYKLYNFMLRSWRRDEEGINLKFRLLCEYPISEYTLTNLERILPQLKENLDPTFWEGLDNKTLYTKIFVALGIYDYEHEEMKYSLKYINYIRDVLDISAQDIEEFVNRAPTEYDDSSDDDSDSDSDNSFSDDDDPDSDDDPVLPFEFEEADDVDEREIRNKLCKDLITLEETHIQEYLRSDDTFLLVSKDSGGYFYMICYDKKYIEHIIENKGNWYYECKGDILPDGHKRMKTTRNEDKALIKIPIHTDGMMGYIPLIELQTLLNRDHKIYYLYSDKTVTHSTSWVNSRRFGNRDMRTGVSNCDDESQIFVYKLKICRNEERCLKSLGQQEFETPSPDFNSFSPHTERTEHICTRSKGYYPTVSFDDQNVRQNSSDYTNEELRDFIKNNVPRNKPIIVSLPVPPSERHAFLVHIMNDKIMIADWNINGGYYNDSIRYTDSFGVYNRFMFFISEFANLLNDDVQPPTTNMVPARYVLNNLVKIEYYDRDEEIYAMASKAYDENNKNYTGGTKSGGCSTYIYKWFQVHYQNNEYKETVYDQKGGVGKIKKTKRRY